MFSSNNHSWHSREERQQQRQWPSYNVLMVCVAMWCTIYLAALLHSFRLIKPVGLLGSKLRGVAKRSSRLLNGLAKSIQKKFIVEYTRHGNPKPGTDDKADAIVIANAGLKTLN
jgi:hypothetical protein